MKKLLFILISFAALTFSHAQASVSEAEAAYANSDFEKAITLYNEVASQEGVSSSLYYNLGNAYFKENNFAGAILNYERALLLDPGNFDARFNLNLANSHIVDKIEPLEVFFLNDWFNMLRDVNSSNEWAYWAIISFILTIISLFFFVFNRNITIRKIGFYCGVVFLTFSILANIFSGSQKAKIEKREFAIVTMPTVTVKGSPADSGTELFVIHEGTKVKVKSSLSGWYEIEIADGNVGWLQSSAIVRI